MKIEDFCELLKTELKENGNITTQTNFKELENYGSLSAVLILQVIEDQFAVKINPRRFRSITTVQDLIDVIGEDNIS